MKKALILLLFILSFILFACNEKEDEVIVTDLNVKTNYYVNSETYPGLGEEKEVRAQLTNEMFLQDNNVYHLEIAKLAALFAISNCYYNENGSFTNSSKNIAQAFKSAQFDDYNLASIDTKPTKDNLGYAYGFKKMNGYDLVILSITGIGYETQYANNVYMGSTGKHAGIDLWGNYLYGVLKNYVIDKKLNNVKILITGYSRGGMVSADLGSIIDDKNDSNINKDNTFIYAFSDPKIFVDEDSSNYKNIFNIINSKDLLQRLMPQSFGFHHVGQVIDIYDLDKFIEATDYASTIKLSTFELYHMQLSLSGISFEKVGTVESLDQYIDTFVNNLSFSSRSFYADNIEEILMYFVDLVYANIDKMDGIKESFLNNMNLGKVFAMLESVEELYQTLSNVLTENEIEYEEDKLFNICQKINKLIKIYLENKVFYSIIDEIITFAKNYEYVLANHGQETIYYLLFH